MAEDLSPNRVNVYGWIVMRRLEDGKSWTVATDNEYPNLPEHHEFLEVAQQHALHLRGKGFVVRIAGLLQEPELDNPEEEDEEWE